MASLDKLEYDIYSIPGLACLSPELENGPCRPSATHLGKKNKRDWRPCAIGKNGPSIVLSLCVSASSLVVKKLYIRCLLIQGRLNCSCSSSPIVKNARWVQPSACIVCVEAWMGEGWGWPVLDVAHGRKNKPTDAMDGLADNGLFEGYILGVMKDMQRAV